MNKHFVSFLEKRMNKTIEGIYLTGSEINDLNVKGTHDRDLLIFVQDSKKDIINNKLFSKQFTETFDNQEYDIKAYDLRKLYSLIKKSNFNILEIFGNDPLYSKKDVLMNMLSDKNNWRNIASFNLTSLCHSFTGITSSTLKRIKNKGIENKESIKSMVQAFKYQYYLINLYHCINFETKCPFELKISDLKVTKDVSLKELKQSAYDGHLNENRLKDCLNALETKVSENELIENLLIQNSEKTFERNIKFKQKLETNLAIMLSKFLLQEEC